MTNLSDTLAALSEAATQGEWSIGAYYVGTGPSERCGGMVEVDDFPNGIIDEEPASAEGLSPNLEFIIALVNAYRTGQLVPVPSVERLALLERLEASTESMERTLAAMDRYNEKNGTAIIGPSLLTLGKMIAANRAVIAAMKEGRADFVTEPLRKHLAPVEPDVLVDCLRELVKDGVPATDAEWAKDADRLRSALASRGLEIGKKGD